MSLLNFGIRASSLLLPGASAEVDLREGLIAAWDFEQDSGNLLDYSPNAYDFVPTGTINYGLTGDLGKHIRIPSPANSNYLSAAYSGLMEAVTGDVPFYGAIRFRLLSLSSSLVIIGSWNYGANDRSWHVYYSSVSYRLSFWVSSNGSNFGSAETSPFTDTGSWHTLEFFHDPVSNLIGIALDNGNWITAPWTSGIHAPVNPESQELTLFRYTASSTSTAGTPFAWTAIALWNRILSDEERALIWNDGNGLSGFDIYAQHLQERIVTATNLEIAISPYMINGYSGPVFQVRRSSDDALRFFTAIEVFNGALENWVGWGNDGFVVTYYDQSGNGRHFTQPSATSQPRIVKNGVLVRVWDGGIGLEFDGSNDFLAYDGGAFGVVNNLVIAAQLQATQRVLNDGFMSVAIAGQRDYDSLAGRTLAMSAGLYEFYGHGGGALANSMRLQSPLPASYTDISFTSFCSQSGGVGEIYENGSLAVSDTYSLSPALQAPTLMRLGARYDLNTSNYGAVVIGTVAVFSVDKTADRAQIEAAIASEPQPSQMSIVPEVAYSVFSLLGYSGDVVIVRRSSDNALSGFTAAEITNGTLTAWVGAGNDGFVLAWLDQSGHGRHAVQSVATAQPRIVIAGALVTLSDGKPALDFDGSNDFLGYDNALGIRLDYVLAARFQVSSWTQNEGIISVAKAGQRDWSTLSGRTLSMRSSLYGFSGHSNFYGSGLGNSVDVNSLKSTATLNEATTVFVQESGGSVELWEDGASIATDTHTFPSPELQAPNLLRIGSRYDNATTQYGALRMSSVVIYSTPQTANRSAIESAVIGPNILWDFDQILDKIGLWLDMGDPGTMYDAVSGGSLVAPDGAVARLEDKSLFNRDFTQSSSSIRPIRKQNSQNGLDAIEFTSAQFMNLGVNSIMRNRTEAAILAVAERTGGNATRGSILRVNLDAGTSSIAGVWANDTAVEAGGRRTGSESFDSITRPGTGTLIAGGIFRWGSSDLEVLVNGETTVKSDFHTEGASQDVDSIDAAIGARTGGSELFAGRIMQIVVLYDLSYLEQSVGRLAHRWGLVGNLPPSHPYKTMPPYIA